MYNKTEWKARKGANLNRFEKSQETGKSVNLENVPSAVTEPGTPVTVANLNKIEQGIYDAHEMVAQEAKARESAIAAEEQYRAAALHAHDASATAHADIRDVIKNLTGLPSWDVNSNVITFRAQDGSTLSIDLPLEALAQDISYDPAKKELILIKHDSSQIRVSIADLVDVYTGSLGAHIQITVGANNQINAVLRAGSITEADIASALLNTLVRTNEKGAANGVATLGADGKVPLAQMSSEAAAQWIYISANIAANTARPVDWVVGAVLYGGTASRTIPNAAGAGTQTISAYTPYRITAVTGSAGVTLQSMGSIRGGDGPQGLPGTNGTNGANGTNASSSVILQQITTAASSMTISVAFAIVGVIIKLFVSTPYADYKVGFYRQGNSNVTNLALRVSTVSKYAVVRGTKNFATDAVVDSDGNITTPAAMKDALCWVTISNSSSGGMTVNCNINNNTGRGIYITKIAALVVGPNT